ncbi:hypothetical protein KAFR_0A05370 [Kazachstania africana CBS 2517]|uniref:Peptidase M16 N-terminal domain-containing protein n=1 Tax=Kazachstania africana (strain ATCC 22294 / BCRC 22015 / CBS 2517 / CECT 1963 / NBRC 1671 / NRRL Y-8276) TaxID=1071382 RepID=H2ANM2_KAZAF|nr:hypothetical protein KAFR_0A05370 [Kazachstania africana CBS 2517]CCF55972.1 hypothetical protein KAFR_0A05370 [Kazachstania africana CBS 2517]
MSWTEVRHHDVQLCTPLSYSNRTHKLCTLPNGIPTLLISDPADTSSACSLTVATGSHNDPPNIPGLAHLAEHMILAAGSKQYPDPGLYHELISKNNGSQNAFTTGEQTTFYFELPDTHKQGELEFDKVLDVFASFFKNPLFNSSIINKEIYAIENEHTNNMSRQTKILYHSTRLLANKFHPFSQFTTGNIFSLDNNSQLRSISIKSLLVNYFAEHFKANKMTLCLRGPHSVNVLTKLAIAKFSDIKSQNDLQRNKFGSISSKRDSRQPRQGYSKIESSNILENIWSKRYANLPCFVNESKKVNSIFIKSKKKPLVRFLFPLSSQSTIFTQREIILFSNFWCTLFGDESEGSLMHFLVEKGWSTSGHSYVSTFAVGSIGLVIELALTNSGVGQITDIINVLFEKIVKILTTKHTTLMADFLNEQNIIEQVRFLYRGVEKDPMEECSDLSGLLQENMQVLDIKYLFKGSPSITQLYSGKNQYSESMTDGKIQWTAYAIKFQNFLLTFMNYENLRLLFLGSNAKETRLITKEKKRIEFETDFFYEFDFYRTFTDFRKCSSDIETENYIFTLPSSNLFIPKSCRSYTYLQQAFQESSLKSKLASLRPQVQIEKIHFAPTLVSDSPNYEMWTLPCAINSSPSLRSKTIVTFELISTNMIPSAESTIHLEILAQLLFYLVSSKLYPSLKLGYSYDIASSSKGDVRLKFTISGFSEGLLLVLEEIIQSVLHIAKDKENIYVTNELLRKARVLVRRKYDEACCENCAKLGSVGLLILLESFLWTLEDRIDALEDTDMTSFKNFVNEFLFESFNYFTLFIQGNLDRAHEIHHYLNDNLTHHLDILPEKVILNKPRTKILQEGSNFFVAYDGHEEDPNNAIVYFIQSGLRSDSIAYTLTAFTEYLMSMTLLPDLRHKKQIGYIVVGGMRVLVDSIGLHITVVSGTPPQDLEDKIDEYMNFLERIILGRLTEEEFRNQYVQNYLDMLNGKNNGTLNGTAGAHNLLNDIVSNVANGEYEILNSSEMREHKRLWNQISDDDHSFLDDIELINREVIETLTLKGYMQFFKKKISIHSNKRSKLSVMVTSPMPENEIINRKLFLQLEAFLKIKGFAIKSNQLKEIVDKADGKPSVVLKLLLSEFRERNEAWKLLRAVLKEVLKTTGQTLKHRYGKVLPSPTKSDNSASLEKSSNYSVKPVIPLKRIEDLNIFKSEF